MNPEFLMSKFYKDQNKLDSLLADLRDNSLLQRQNLLKIFKPTDFDEQLQFRLTELGITKFLYYTTSCNNYSKLEFDLTTNWSKKIPVHITQSMCENNMNIKGYHSKLGSENEGWGLGDNWLIWVERAPMERNLEYFDKKVDTINHADQPFK